MLQRLAIGVTGLFAKTRCSSKSPVPLDLDASLCCVGMVQIDI
jgi:hypothetical protein